MATLRELLFREETAGPSRKAGAAGSNAQCTGSPVPGSAVPGGAEDQPANGNSPAGMSTAQNQRKTSSLSLGSGLLSQKTPSDGERESHHFYQNLKTRIHNRLIDNLDIKALTQLEGSEALETAIE